MRSGGYTGIDTMRFTIWSKKLCLSCSALMKTKLGSEIVQLSSIRWSRDLESHVTSSTRCMLSFRGPTIYERPIVAI